MSTSTVSKPSLRVFSTLVNLAAVCLTLSAPWPKWPELWATTFVLATLAAFAGYRPVRIASLRTELIATHPFIFCALGTIGPISAAVVAMAGVLATMIRKESRLDRFRMVFNLGAVLLSTATASWVFLLLGGESGAPLLTVLGPLSGAAAVYFLVNTGLVAKAISLDKNMRLLEAWQRCVQWTTLSFFSGMTFAAGLVLYMDALGNWGLILGIPPCFLLISFYRVFKQRTEEQEQRIRESEKMNAELEQRVRERTHELEAALEQVRDLQALRATLSQTLIHDLKNPLAVVVGNLDLLEMKGESRTMHLVRRSKGGASRLLSMILDLLDISGMEENRFVVREDPVNLGEIVRKAAADASVGAAERDVSIEVETPETPAIVAGDGSVLRRILDNLLSNALHYSPAGSTVSLALRVQDQAFDLAVTDQGPGIPEAFRTKVFEKFSQGDCRAAGVTANRGLGLTFCQMAIEAHRGMVRVEEAPGGGALMRVRLPLGDPLCAATDVAPDDSLTVAGAEPRPQLTLVG